MLPKTLTAVFGFSQDPMEQSPVIGTDGEGASDLLFNQSIAHLSEINESINHC